MAQGDLLIERKRKTDALKTENVRQKLSKQDIEVEWEELLENEADQIDLERYPSRKPLSPLDPSRDAIVFQQLDCDHEEGKDGPVVRMYGVTAQGHSVLAYVQGFRPYFYVDAPKGMREEDCLAFRTALNKRVNGAPVRDVTMELKQSVMFYTGNDKVPFLKITIAAPNRMNPTVAALEQGFDFDGSGPRRYQTYEATLDFVLRFMTDAKVVGCNWIELPPTKYRLRPLPARSSNSQIEVEIDWADMVSHACEGEWLNMAPLRILSVDIECAGRPGVFPVPEEDAVITIANLVTVTGQSKPLYRCVFTLNSCAPIAGVNVRSFNNEADMLRDWKRFVVEIDPDILTGYNIINFDLPYLLNRAAALSVNAFPFLGRHDKVQTKMRDTQFSSKAFGTHESKAINMEGRIIFDMLQIITRDYKLRSYSLNSVSAHFLGEQKEDVHWSKITELFKANDQTRRRIAVYCLKDAYLPQRLIDKLMSLFNYTEMARVTGIPLGWLLARGHMIKVVSQLHRKAAQLDLLIPDMKTQGQQSGPQYEGAIVIEPRKGFYDEPIVVLDFASLYPSIMMAHNLCYSTLLRKDDIPKLGLTPDQYTQTPNGDFFVKSSVCKGVLPVILDELLAARKKAKVDLKNATDPFLKAVLDGRQLALKISANAVYGFTGASVGKLPCTEIAGSVTAFGRQMIEATRSIIEAKYTTDSGCSANAQVIYGDTDSVMINFGVPDMDKAFDLGKDAAKVVTANFPPPVKLEFEKVFFPYLLIQKKRYAGLLWTNTQKFDKMDAKGIETVRRDNCPLVGNVISTCLHKILIQRDIQAAINYAKGIISDLLCNRLDLSQLVITKELTKTAENYDAKQAHVELAERIRKRDPGSAPAIGDRVPFVIIKAAKGAKAYEKSEDPIWVLENNIPLDTQYYLEHILAPPLIRIFEGVMKDPNELITGEHTRTISVPTPSVGGIMKFTHKTATCLACKAVLKQHERTVCGFCAPREGEIYQRTISRVGQLESTFAQVWTQCQRCTASLHQDVLCTSRDCPIFYMRRKVQKDLRDAQAALDRFSF